MVQQTTPWQRQTHMDTQLHTPRQPALLATPPPAPATLVLHQVALQSEKGPLKLATARAQLAPFNPM